MGAEESKAVAREISGPDEHDPEPLVFEEPHALQILQPRAAIGAMDVTEVLQQHAPFDVAEIGMPHAGSGQDRGLHGGLRKPLPDQPESEEGLRGRVHRSPHAGQCPPEERRTAP